MGSRLGFSVRLAAFLVAVAAWAAPAAFAQTCNANLALPPAPSSYSVEPPNVNCPNATGTDDCTGSPSPAVGTLCTDGTVYVGTSPDGGGKMFTTRCDAGMSWNGSACAPVLGVQPLFNWGANGLTSNISSTVTGRANSAALAVTYADTRAAQFCEKLVAYGHSDWYLPAKDELAKINTAKASGRVAGTLDITGTYYWSSSEYGTNSAWFQRFSDGFQGYSSEGNAFYVRCVRRD